jgi:hypothetical protein
MYIYNVTIKIEAQIQDSWLAWMQNTHISEVLATGMFEDARLSQLLEPQIEEDNSFTYVVQYFTTDIKNYETYINEFAPSLREKGFAEFGNQFIAFRSLLKSIQ